MENIVSAKRFEFCAGHRLSRPAREGRFHGHNYTLWVGVSGDVDAVTGMAISLGELKLALGETLDRYDHRNLNTDVPRLRGVDSTVSAVAHSLWHDIGAALPAGIRLDHVRLKEEAGPGASICRGESRSLSFGAFSAAHRTHAPALSEEENLARFGICSNPAGHGHNYRVEAAFRDAPPDDPLPAALREFDHRNLSVDIADFAGRNVVTEGVASLIWDRLTRSGGPAPVEVGVFELDDFFAAYRGPGEAHELGRRYHFHAAHRLHSDRLTPEENEAVFGKCSRPGGHGHTYTLEVVVAGRLDPKTETAYDLGELDRAAGMVVGALEYRDLDRDVPALHGRPTTGENIARHLWDGLRARLGEALVRVRLRETPNNLFVIERDH